MKVNISRVIKGISRDLQNDKKAIIHFDKITEGKDGSWIESKSCTRTMRIVGINRFQIVFNRVVYTFSWNVQGEWKDIERENRYGDPKEDVQIEGVEKEVKEESKEEKRELEVKEEEQEPEVNYDEEVRHSKYDEIKTCIECNIPVYLYGPAGSGKNHTLEDIAWDLGLDFYFTNSVQQEYKITGFIDAGGVYHETEFYKSFKYGGVFFLDEMDASIPEVLVLLNAAIANGYFEFPNGKIFAHEDFRVVAAGNTIGCGADEMYTGRLVLDQATLDRFAVIEFGYDERIEMKLSKGNKELVEFIHDIRKQSEEKGIRCTFSYRCISMVTKLEEADMGILNILRIAVFKGLDKDTLNTFEANDLDNNYMVSLSALQGLNSL